MALEFYQKMHGNLDELEYEIKKIVEWYDTVQTLLNNLKKKCAIPDKVMKKTQEASCNIKSIFWKIKKSRNLIPDDSDFVSEENANRCLKLGVMMVEIVSDLGINRTITTQLKKMAIYAFGGK